MNSVEKMNNVEKKVKELHAKVHRNGYTQPVHLQLTVLELAELAAFVTLQRKEVERLRADIKRLTDWSGEKLVKICELEADKANLLAALEMIAGSRQCIDSLMSDKDIALAAIAQVSK